MFPYILFLIVSSGWSKASRIEKVAMNSKNPLFPLLVINAAGQRTSEAWRKFIESPRSVPLKAPSFIIYVNKKLRELGLPTRLIDGAA